MEKLLLHRIPINVPREEISRVIPGDVAIEMKVDYFYFYLVFSIEILACLFLYLLVLHFLCLND